MVVLSLTYRDKKHFTLIGNTESLVNLTCMSLDCGGKLANPEETHTGMGEHASSTEKGPGRLKLITFRLVVVLTTAPLCCPPSHSFKSK